jgi:L-seryl-tRNA(Ser) seleniumtransferase
MTPRRTIPAVARVLDALGDSDLPRPLVTRMVRQHLAEVRAQSEIPAFNEIVRTARMRLALIARSRLRPIINGTGIILHTNFGRAPLGGRAVRALTEIAANYNNLE